MRSVSKFPLCRFAFARRSAFADTTENSKVETVRATAEANRDTSSAIGLALTPRQTPQSVTVVAQNQIQSFTALWEQVDIVRDANGLMTGSFSGGGCHG